VVNYYDPWVESQKKNTHNLGHPALIWTQLAGGDRRIREEHGCLELH
jgi:hypothetical protein